MRSTAVKTTTKKTFKPSNKKPIPPKTKKMSDLKSPVRDTISETISFVIKGKLTPIKPILIDDKHDLVTKAKLKSEKCGKVLKMRNCKKLPKIQVAKKPVESLNIKPKVQVKTAKKPSAQITKKSVDKILTDVIPPTPKVAKIKKNIKPEKKQPVVKVNRRNGPIRKLNAELVEVIKKPLERPKKNTCKKIKEANAEKKNKQESKPNPSVNDDDELKKQQTIEKLLKQANKELIANTTKPKLKKVINKSSKGIKKVQKQPKIIQVKKKINEKIKSEVNTNVDYTSDEIPLKELSQKTEDKTEQSIVQPKNTENDPKPDTPLKIIAKRKINPKVTLLKKRVIASKNKLNKDEKCKKKLFAFSTGPKCHRVASLNALAKVHCLYENETRGNILDIIDANNIKKEFAIKKENIKKETKFSIKKEVIDMEERIPSEDPLAVPTKTLRSVPGLRAIGKHWDMHETSSSSEDNSGSESSSESVPIRIKKEKTTQQKPVKEKRSETKTKDKKRRRNRNEIIMDLKDMVVQKRMASLNASAILAASYSVEKRPPRPHKDCDDSSSYASGSSEEYFAASDDDTKDEDEVKKEEDRNMIEVHTTPNKKVAVILNQDTDVTITGVYVNSTTRSTHHEGYCSIAGMQYRISATSHTQTAATAVATETLLQSSSSSAPDNSNSDSLPSSKSYTPLDALSNMQPPPGPGIQHNHPVLHNQQHMGPPQHVLPIPPHQLSPGLRHGCSSAFSSPHSTSNYQLPPTHHAPIQPGEPGYVHGRVEYNPLFNKTAQGGEKKNGR